MQDLAERLVSFSIEIIKLFRKLPITEEYKIIRYQLIRSATSSGANYEEAQGASSRADFTNKVRISLKEMRESNYWLRVIEGINEQSSLQDEIKNLIEESSELKNILGAICSKTTRKNT
ncbi:MAG: four helix bundle protein [Bacteroidales bacterium]|nr:four helix bundle protein [Bacteroidales bacterium]